MSPLALRALTHITHPRIMILRTAILLGLGAAQPVGLALAAGPALSQEASVDAKVEPREALARDFASWRVDLITQGEASSVLTDLQALVARGEAIVFAAPEDEAASLLLTDLYVEEFTQSERRLALGPLQALFLRRLRAAHDPGTGAAAKAIARASGKVVTVERIEQLIGAPLASQGDVGTGPDARQRLGPHAQMIAAAVKDALEAGDQEFIEQLGSAAAEPLAAAALKVSGERLPEGHLDPLELLVSMDPAAALDVALAHVRNEDLLLKVRVVDAFTTRDPFKADSVWTQKAGGGFELVNPDWAQVVVALYQAPAVDLSSADQFLRTFARRGYAPFGLQGLLPGCLARAPLGSGPVWPVAMEAAETLLASDRAEEQRAGLKVVLQSQAAKPAWAVVDSTSGRVREVLARTFGPRNVGSGTVVPALDADYRTALRVFLGVPVDGAVTSGSGGDPVAVALQGAARLGPTDGPPAADAASLIQLFDRSPLLSPAALEAALMHLDPLGASDRADVIGAATRAMLRALDGPSAPWVARAPAVLQALLGASVDAGEPEAFVDVFEEAADAGDWRHVVETSRSETQLTRFSPHLKRLSPALQMKIARALWRTGYDNFGWLGEDELSLRRDNWLELAGDERLPKEARVWALKAMAGEEGSPAPEGAAAELAKIVADLGSCPIGSGELSSMGFDPEDYLNRLLDLPGASDEAVLGVYIQLEDGATVERLLKRFPPATWTNHRSAPLLSSVISALVHRRDPALNGMLMAANIRRTTIQGYLVRALHAERFVGHLPLGGAILKVGVVEQDLAVDFVGSFMTDDAARYLVEAMETARSESYRAQLFTALQALTERREVAERWMRSSDAAARHELAVRKLVAVIDASGSTVSARAEAILGLGLLDARDELPRLIELLDADDEALRVAARSAIDRMAK